MGGQFCDGEDMSYFAFMGRWWHVSEMYENVMFYLVASKGWSYGKTFPQACYF